MSYEEEDTCHMRRRIHAHTHRLHFGIKESEGDCEMAIGLEIVVGGVVQFQLRKQPLHPLRPLVPVI
jgi:hypothetical protein